MSVTYLCRHDDHPDCPAPSRCSCSCHRQLAMVDRVDAGGEGQLPLPLDDVEGGRR